MKLERDSSEKQIRVFAIQLCILLLKAKREEISIKELLNVLDEFYGLGKENPVTYKVFNILYEELLEKSAGFLRLKSNSIEFYETKIKEVCKIKELKGRELARFLYENKYCYIGKQIRGLDIWGIGTQAITLGNVSINAHSDGTPTGLGPIRQCHNKKFHNFFKKVNNENSFSDGLELAEEIVKEYGYLSWEEEGIKQKKELEEMEKGY